MSPWRTGPLASSGNAGSAKAGENLVATTIETPAAKASLKVRMVLTCSLSIALVCKLGKIPTALPIKNL